MVVCYRLPQGRQVGDLHLPAETLTLGYFWQQRPYNAYHFIAPSGQTLGCYCNICDRTVIDDSSVHWRDLVIDVLLLPGGAHRILDREQLPVALSPAIADYIDSAVKELLEAKQALLAELEVNRNNYLRLAAGVNPGDHD